MNTRQTCQLFCITTLAAASLAPTVLTGCNSEPAKQRRADAEKRPSSVQIELTSEAFDQGQPIPAKYTADGANVSPPLSWSNLPQGTKELALICDDPDAPDPGNPRDEPWVHWVAYKIPANATGLPEAVAQDPRPTEPAGMIQGDNSWPEVGYRGPQPPVGNHRYFFKLYALDAALDLEPGLDKDSLLQAIEGHVVAEGQLMGTYQKR